MITPDKTFGQRLKEFRKDRKISQIKLAELARVSLGTISSYEADEVMPSLGTVVHICDILEVDIEYLIPEDWHIQKEN